MQVGYLMPRAIAWRRSKELQARKLFLDKKVRELEQRL